MKTLIPRLMLLGCVSLALSPAAWTAETPKAPDWKEAPPGPAAQSAPEPQRQANPPDKAGLFAGYRGMSLPVSGHQLAFLKKGDHVDVLVTFDALMEGNRKEKVTATILQNVLIVDLLKPAAATDPGAIDFLLNPNEAQYAALSVIQGDIHIVARAPGDFKMQPMEMASFRKLFK